MFKSKHSGWTWDLKRTPFGGGGGWNPVAAITDPISSALGTDGGGGGLLGGLASIDPGPAVGDALASTDKFMTNLTPYGWALPAALVAAYFSGGATLAAEGAVEAGAAAAAGEAAATAAGEAAFSEAVAAGLSEEAAAAAANAAADSALAASTGMKAGTGLEALGTSGGTGLTGGTGGSTGLLTGGTTSGLTIPGGAGIAIDPAIAAGSGAGIGGTGAAIGGGVGTVGGLSAGLPAAGSVGGAGAGMSAELAPGTILGTGAPGGGAIGVSYTAGANGLPATDFFGNYIPSTSTGIGGLPNGSTSLADALKTGNQVRQGASAANSLSKLLSQGAASGLSSSLGQLAKGANPQGQALSPWVHGNQNPFAYTAQQPIQNAKPLDIASLANLLKQG